MYRPSACYLHSTLSKDIRGQDALNVYTRSSMFEDEDLAKAVVKEAASAAMYSIHVSTLASLPASALYRLVSTKTLPFEVRR